MPGLLPVTTEGSRLGVMLSGLDPIHFRFQRGNQVAQRNIVRSAAVGSRLVSKIENPSSHGSMAPRDRQREQVVRFRAPSS